MRFRIYALFGLLFLFTSCVDALTFSGLAEESQVGSAVAKAAETESPLLHAYIVIGRPVTARVRAAATAGQSIADAAFGDAYDRIDATPDAAADLLFSASIGPLRALLLCCYWGAPIFFALTVLAWMFVRATRISSSPRGADRIEPHRPAALHTFP